MRKLDLWRPVVAAIPIAFATIAVSAAVFIVGVAVWMYWHDGGAR